MIFPVYYVYSHETELIVIKDKNICKFIPASGDLGLQISRFIFESDQEIIRQKKNAAQHTALLIVGGEGSFHIGEANVPYAAGSLVFVFKNEDFSAMCEKETAYMYITFGGVRAEELFRRFGINKDRRAFEKHDGLIPLWKESLSRANEDTVDLAAESMLLYTFSRLSGAAGKKNSVMNSITEMTENRFTDPRLGIAAIAAELGYNPNYLSHFFKERSGVTYSEYLRNLRIKYAISLLEHGIDSVKNVALLSGFDDPLYFSTVFKKSVGVSPKEYIGRL